jgi:DNA repair exonuclease SbcCD ATPase subunit
MKDLQATLEAAMMERARKAAIPPPPSNAAGDLCSVCLQPIAPAHVERLQREYVEKRADADTIIAQAVERVDAARAWAQQKEQILHQATTQRDAVQGARELVEELDQAEARLAQLAQLDNTVEKRALDVARNDVAREVEQIHAHLHNLSVRAHRSAEKQKNAWETLIREADQAVTSIQGEVNPETSAVEVLQRTLLDSEISRRELQRDLDKHTHSADVCKYWTKAFSKQGIQSLLMEEVAAAFNAARSTIFPLLTRGVYDVQFSATSRTGAGELREKTDFLVWEHGIPIPYESLSGGQRRRVDLGVMLTLCLAVSRQYAIPGVLGVLVLDEVMENLDEDGAECLYAALTEVSNTIPSVYAITHDPRLQSLFPQVLEVEQGEDGISRIV